MSEPNVEDEERAMDIVWAESTADERMFKRGHPVADIVERDES